MNIPLNLSKLNYSSSTQISYDKRDRTRFFLSSLPKKKKKVIDITGVPMSTIFNHTIRILSKIAYGNMIFPHRDSYALFYMDSHSLKLLPFDINILTEIMNRAAVWLDANSGKYSCYDPKCAEMFLKSKLTQTAVLKTLSRRLSAFEFLIEKQSKYDELTIAKHILMSYIKMARCKDSESERSLLFALLNARRFSDWGDTPQFFIGHDNEPNRALKLVKDIATIATKNIIKCKSSATASDIIAVLPNTSHDDILLFENFDAKIYNSLSEAHDEEVDDGSTTWCKVIGTFDYTKVNTDILTNSCFEIILERSVTKPSVVYINTSDNFSDEFPYFVKWALSVLEDEHDHAVEYLGYRYTGHDLYGCGTWDRNILGILDCNGITF